jgi:hypothetical protein
MRQAESEEKSSQEIYVHLTEKEWERERRN